MASVARDLGAWLWRLVPANPILLRVVHSGGRRTRHLWIRVAYLSILAAATIIGVIVAHQNAGGASLADLAKRATQVFEQVSMIQLILVCILAPIFTAGAITQEKNSQTFNILLTTPLTNAQIVLGSLLSRLFFVAVLLVAGIPLFCIMMVYGGVTGDKIALSIALAGCTALLTGSLAITISVIRIGTGRTIFSFCLTIAIYLIVVYALAAWSAVIPPEAEPAPGQDERMSWLAAFHPFLALAATLGRTPPPDFGSVAHYGFPRSYLLAWPQYCYLAFTTAASLALIVFSLSFVRRGAKEGEATFLNRLFGYRRRAAADPQKARRTRHIGKNPIAWREAVTSASAGGGPIVRYAVFGSGLVFAMLLLAYYLKGNLTVEETRLWLYGAVAVELGITLFVATTTAATSMTREKESNTLELLLGTPMTSDMIIRGKIWGLVHAAGPMLLVPYLTIGLFLLFDLLTGRAFRAEGPVVSWEASLTLPILLVCFTAFACLVGLQASIKARRTLTAVFTSMALVLAVFAVTGGCALAVKESGTSYLTAAFMPVTPITAVYVAIDPASALSRPGQVMDGATLQTCRVVAVVAALCSALVYGLVGYAMHRTMVRNFDMIIRKQTA